MGAFEVSRSNQELYNLEKQAKAQAFSAIYAEKSALPFRGTKHVCVYVRAHQSAVDGTTGTYPSLDVNRDKQPAQHNHKKQGLKPKEKWSQIMLPGGPQRLQNNHAAVSLWAPRTTPYEAVRAGGAHGNGS